VVEETARGADGLVIPRDRVTLLTDSGIEQFILEDADSIAFVDPELQKNVAAALSRLASHRSDGRRRLSLEAAGLVVGASGSATSSGFHCGRPHIG